MSLCSWHHSLCGGTRGRIPVARRARVIVRSSSLATNSVAEAQAAILRIISGAKGRGVSGLSAPQQRELDDAVAALEADGGISDPTTVRALDGKWRLLYTSRPGTSSPIQRSFTGVDAFTIFQEVRLFGEAEARVNNIVDFGPDLGFLKVEAEASTDTRPLPGFIPRRGAGLPLFGKSSTAPPAKKDIRIDFQFDKAAFVFNRLPFNIPYPVPFKYLGDETKGWIDITYMNSDCSFRLTRGNKGTLFVLEKRAADQVINHEGRRSASASSRTDSVVPMDASEATKEALLAAVAAQDDEKVLGIIAALDAQGSPVAAPARSSMVNGTWRLVWSQQAENASALQKWGTQQAKNYQIIGNGALENLVDLGLVQVRAQAACSPSSDTRTSVQIGGGMLVLGQGSALGNGVRVPLPVKGEGFVDWLWLDEGLRITRGSKGSLFIHTRDDAQ